MMTRAAQEAGSGFLFLRIRAQIGAIYAVAAGPAQRQPLARQRYPWRGGRGKKEHAIFDGEINDL